MSLLKHKNSLFQCLYYLLIDQRLYPIPLWPISSIHRWLTNVKQGLLPTTLNWKKILWRSLSLLSYSYTLRELFCPFKFQLHPWNPQPLGQSPPFDSLPRGTYSKNKFKVFKSLIRNSVWLFIHSLFEQRWKFKRFLSSL